MEDYYFNPLAEDSDYPEELKNTAPPTFTTTILKEKVQIDYEAIARRETLLRQTQPTNKFISCLN